MFRFELKNTYLLLFCAFFIVIQVSCSSERRFRRDLQAIYGSEIKIPTDLQAFYNGVDTTWNDLMSGRFKMIIYYDSLSCSSCAVGHFYDWQHVVDTSVEMQDEFNAVFIFSPPQGEDEMIRRLLKINAIDYPVFFDYKGEFASLNPDIVKHKRFHTFLLDSENKVVIVGNPVHDNPQLWGLYEKTIKSSQ